MFTSTLYNYDRWFRQPHLDVYFANPTKKFSLPHIESRFVLGVGLILSKSGDTIAGSARNAEIGALIKSSEQSYNRCVAFRTWSLATCRWPLGAAFEACEKTVIAHNGDADDAISVLCREQSNRQPSSRHTSTPCSNPLNRARTKLQYERMGYLFTVYR